MITEKMLRVTMPGDSVWEVPARIVAANRAAYYEEKGENFDKIFDETMGDERLIRGWAGGDMNWSDVAGYARQVMPTPTLADDDFQEGWVNGKKTIVDVERP